MKKVNFFFILIVLSTLPTNYVFSNDKIAFIDIDLILSKAIASKDLFNELKKNKEIKLNEFKEEEEKLKQMESKILSKKNIISKDEYNKSVKDFKNQVKDYQESKNIIIQNLRKKRNDEVLRFIKLINPFIEQVMSKKSIDILIEKKNVFIAKKNYDITSDVINIINKNVNEFKIKN